MLKQKAFPEVESKFCNNKRSKHHEDLTILNLYALNNSFKYSKKNLIQLTGETDISIIIDIISIVSVPDRIKRLTNKICRGFEQ